MLSWNETVCWLKVCKSGSLWFRMFRVSPKSRVLSNRLKPKQPCLSLVVNLPRGSRSQENLRNSFSLSNSAVYYDVADVSREAPARVTTSDKSEIQLLCVLQYLFVEPSCSLRLGRSLVLNVQRGSRRQNSEGQLFPIWELRLSSAARYESVCR